MALKALDSQVETRAGHHAILDCIIKVSCCWNNCAILPSLLWVRGKRRHLTKNGSVTMGLAALLLAGAIQAQDITVKWPVKGDHLLHFYLPKVASDGILNVVTIAEVSTGLSPLEDDLGFISLSRPPR